MWSRVILAAISALVSLVLLALYSGAITVAVELPQGVQAPEPIQFIGQPLGFWLAIILIVICALPLGLGLWKRFR